MASETIQELKIKISGDDKDWQTAVKRLKAELDALAKKGDETAQKLSASLSKSLSTKGVGTNSIKRFNKIQAAASASKRHLKSVYGGGSAQESARAFKSPKITSNIMDSMLQDYYDVKSGKNSTNSALYGLNAKEAFGNITSPAMKASQTLLADQLREEERNAKAIAEAYAAQEKRFYNASPAMKASDTLLADKLREEERISKAIGDDIAAQENRRYKTKPTMKASETLLADQLRQEEKDAKKLEKENERVAKKVVADEQKAREKAEKEAEKKSEASRKKRIEFALASVKTIGKATGKIGTLVTSPVAKGLSAISKFFKKLKGIALYRTVRAVLSLISSGMKEGINNLYKFSSVTNQNFKKSLDSISTDALYVKNSFASMVEPLINALVPIVRQLADEFNKAATAVGQFFAFLTGQDYFSKAIRQMKQYQKAQRDLLGFDEINRLSGDQEDYSGMFENIDVALKSLSVEIEGLDFYDKINMAIDSIDPIAIGQRLGEKINAGVSKVSEFFSDINWVELGGKLGSTLDQTIKNIDWGNVLTTIFGTIQTLFESATEFLQSIDWENVGETIVNALKEVKWKELLTSIAEFICTFAGAALLTLWSGIKSIWDKDIKSDAESEAADAGAGVATALYKGFKEKLDDLIMGTFYNSKIGFSEETSSNYDKATTSVQTPLSTLVGNVINAQSKYLNGSVSQVPLSDLIKLKAGGGFVDTGDLFIANEAGPELVGTIGNRTAVTNQDQFVSAVAGAMAPVIQAIYDTGSANVSAINNMPTPSIRIGDREIYQASRRGSKVVGSSLVQGV